MLAGLANAPQYLTNKSDFQENGCITASDVDSIILPADACGGDAVLAFANKKAKVNITFLVIFHSFQPSYFGFGFKERISGLLIIATYYKTYQYLLRKSSK